jgi:hypothetical protein
MLDVLEGMASYITKLARLRMRESTCGAPKLDPNLRLMSTRFGKKLGDRGHALDQLGNVRDMLHHFVPKCGKDGFIPFTHGLFHEASTWIVLTRVGRRCCDH